MAKTLFDQTRSERTLWSAWRHVRSKGLGSVSPDTRSSIREFDSEADRNIARLTRRLRARRFEFAPAYGILKKRPGKSPRPIELSPVGDRIVRRSLLDTLNRSDAMRKYRSVATSFGTRGVPPAVKAAHDAIRSGSRFFASSDIKDFFTNIPRDLALARIAQATGDPDFEALLRAATTSELENLTLLGDDARYFPTEEFGVAQGNALSALLGDVLLYDFDVEMNKRGIVCLRYVDDFVMLGAKQRHLTRAFDAAQERLRKLGLEAYDPSMNADKAATGRTEDGFEFLGCFIQPSRVRPTREAKVKLLEAVQKLLSESAAAMRDPGKLRGRKSSLVETLHALDHLLKGWGNQYKFCNDRGLHESIDLEIERRLAKFLRMYSERRRELVDNDDSHNARRLLGVHLLTDSKFEPITG